MTFAGQRSGEGYFSQDGKRLIFQSEREPGNPFYQIYLMDLQTGDSKRVSPGYGKTTCGWIHPAGKKVLFSSTHADPKARAKQKAELKERESGKRRRYAWDYDEYYDIYEAELASGKLRNLTDTLGYDAEASWSPDGKLIAFASNRHAQGKPPAQSQEKQDPAADIDIYIMNADGSGARRLTDTPGYDGGPFFSADGRKIVWRRFAADGATAEIYSMNVDGSDQRRITRLNAMSWAPYFHPSGDYIIFATNVHGHANFELYAVDAEGRAEPVRVTATAGFDGLPVFSPDGRVLVWTSGRGPDKKSQLFMARWNDAEARRRLGLPNESAAGRAGAAGEALEPSRTIQNGVDPADLRSHVARLAAEETEGRLTGSEGERLAAEYVAGVFQKLGLKPAGDRGSYFQSFEFTAGVVLGTGNRLALTDVADTTDFSVNKDWRPLAFSKVGKFDPAEVVFAGYGIIAPAASQFPAYDSYVDLDVKDKWVLVFRELPEEVTAEHRQHLHRYATVRYKAMLARDQGAHGLILVSGPNARVKEKLIRLKFDTALAGTSIAAISITDELGERLIASSGKKLKALQDALDTGKPVAGFALGHARLSAVIDIEQERRSSRNVVARLPAAGRPGQAVVVGAHLDHLGRGEGGDTLAREEEKGEIHFGADDNASGVAGLLAIARSLSGRIAEGTLRLRRDVILAAWSGEELGLIGSSHFARTYGSGEKEPKTLYPRIAAYVNMDMIGRWQGELILQGMGSSTRWPALIERANAQLGLPIMQQKDSYLPTDATAFYLKGVPVLNAFTGAHGDYHSPRDTAEKLDYEATARISRLLADVSAYLASARETLDYVETEKPTGGMGRRNLRVYLGSIPDYAQTEGVGVKLSGVAKGGPASEAGLRAGDVIVELAGRKIENIYDYTYALEALKAGETVAVVVQRGDARLKLKLTPVSRE